jgi:hypothetical protein
MGYFILLMALLFALLFLLIFLIVRKKKRKPILIVLVALIIIVSVATLFLVYPYLPKRSDVKLTPDQQKVIDILGYPDQFVITYVENGGDSKPQLIRDEIWTYAKSGKSVTFLGGKLAYSDDYSTKNQIVQTTYHPEDFQFDQNYSDIKNQLNNTDIYEVNDIPGVTDQKNIKVYTANGILFVFENGYLTYVQTIVSDNSSK